MQYLESKGLLSLTAEPLFGDRTPEKDRFLADLAKGGFNDEDFQKALRYGLITRGPKLVRRRYGRGVFRLIPGLLMLRAAWALYSLMSSLPSPIAHFPAIAVLVTILLGVSFLLYRFYRFDFRSHNSNLMFNPARTKAGNQTSCTLQNVVQGRRRMPLISSLGLYLTPRAKPLGRPLTLARGPRSYALRRESTASQMGEPHATDIYNYPRRLERAIKFLNAHRGVCSCSIKSAKSIRKFTPRSN